MHNSRFHEGVITFIENIQINKKYILQNNKQKMHKKYVFICVKNMSWHKGWRVPY